MSARSRPTEHFHHLASQAVHWFQFAFLISVYFVLVASAALELKSVYDFLVYHLPDALHRFGLTTFETGAMHTGWNRSLPPLPHLIQGFLVFVTGWIPSAQLLGATGFGFLLLVIYRLFGRTFSYRSFLMLCLAIPMFCTHFVTGLVDLFAGCMAVSIFVAFLRIELNPRKVRIRDWILLCICLLLSMLSKPTVWIPAAVISCFAAVRLIQHFIRHTAPYRVLAVLSVLFLVCAFIWPVHNVVEHGNPAYPMDLPFLSVSDRPSDPLIGVVPRKDWMPRYFHDSSNIVRFIFSAFELTRFLTSEKLVWSMYQWPAGGSTSPHLYMGGWSGLTFSFLICGMLFSVYKRILPARFSLCVSTSIAVVAFSPTGFGLRYFLFVPILLAFLLAFSQARFSVPLRNFTAFCSLCLALNVVARVVSPTIVVLDVVDLAPPEARRFWEVAERNGSGKRHRVHVCQRKNSIFWAGPALNEYQVSACE